MRELTEMERRAATAVQKLRMETLRNGQSFLIYDNALPNGRYYLEHPDGQIDVVTVSRKFNEYIVEKKLTSEQITAVRQAFNTAHF